MPYPLTSSGIKRNQTGAIQVVARMMTPIVVDRDSVCGDKNLPQFLVRRDRCPGGDIASVLPRVVFPGFVSVFPRLRDYIKLPEELPTFGVVT